MPAPDASLLALRRYFDLTQPDLADYLGLSRTLLAHAEAGRRSLPLEATARLLPLLGLLPPPHGSGPADPPPLPPDPAEVTPSGAAALRTRLDTCRYEAGNLAYRLRQLQRRATPLRRRRALPALLAALPPPVPLPASLLGLPPAPPDWAAYLAAQAAYELPRSGQLAQGLLEARRVGLAAEAACLEALLATLPPPEPPLAAAAAP